MRAWNLELLIKFIENVEKWRYKPFFLIAVFLVILVGALYVSLPDGINVSIQNRFVVGLIMATVVTLISWHYQQPPTVTDGNVGIIIAVRSEDKKIKERISKDFIEACKSMLGESRAHQPFQLIELNDFFSELAKDDSSANQLRVRCKGHLLIYGDAVQRRERGKNLYVFRLQGIVCHVATSPNTQSILAQEMAAVLPLKKEILEDSELSGFEVTSIQLAEATKYVIATAALISHDYGFAISLLEELQQEKGSLRKNANVRAIQKLIELIPNRLADSYRFAAAVHFLRWEMSREEKDLRESISWEVKYNSIKPGDNLRLLLSKAIACFVFARDINGAMGHINQCRSKFITEPAWKYSAAFLEAYRNKLDAAMHYYDAAIPTERGFAIPFQIEGFIAWILEIEPQANQLNFCLGYLNEKFKHDSVSATRYYGQFLSSPCEEANSRKAIAHAKAFMEKT